jgi:hypothetical protein
MTDNDDGLDSNIKIIDLDMSLDLESYWWKICLFNLDLEGTILYFDLDIVIQNSFDYLLQSYEKRFIKALNINHHGAYYPYDGGYTILTIPQTIVNSSVMLFESNQHKDIYDNFISDIENNIIFYYGLDRFFSKLYLDRFTWFDYSKDYYFRNKGVDHYDTRFIDSSGYVHDPRCAFCVISQGDPDVYEGIEKYFRINKNKL